MNADTPMDSTQRIDRGSRLIATIIAAHRTEREACRKLETEAGARVVWGSEVPCPKEVNE